MADLGVAQLHDMREQAEMIANLDPSGPPLIADMDTGYGGMQPPTFIPFTTPLRSISSLFLHRYVQSHPSLPHLTTPQAPS